MFPIWILFVECPCTAQRTLLRATKYKWKFYVLEKIWYFCLYFSDNSLWTLELLCRWVDIAVVSNACLWNIDFVLGVIERADFVEKPSNAAWAILLSAFGYRSFSYKIKRTSYNDELPIFALFDDSVHS